MGVHLIRNKNASARRLPISPGSQRPLHHGAGAAEGIFQMQIKHPQNPTPSLIKRNVSTKPA